MKYALSLAVLIFAVDISIGYLNCRGLEDFCAKIEYGECRSLFIPNYWERMSTCLNCTFKEPEDVQGDLCSMTTREEVTDVLNCVFKDVKKTLVELRANARKCHSEVFPNQTSPPCRFGNKCK